ncbi:excisionase family protein [Escherichia sp. E4208]|uniref:excisionase family protein n=1 Tax=Escherichia sp. E4208 TaxID=2044463 RepID=UPI00107EF956|nr:excisionase family protein [Escherichia sp. E4208]
MSEVNLIVPNDWVTEQKLIEITGLRPGTIERARKQSWLVGREYLHVAPDGIPKENSECMYNRKAIDQWVESMSKKTAWCASMKNRLCLIRSWASGGNNG